MATHEVLFQPLTIKGVTIPNRFVSTSHQPGYAARGRVTERYLRYEAEKARGGVGLVQFAGATSVSIENCYYYGQLDATTDAVVPDLQRMADAIHRHGAACTAQLTHGGRRERYDIANWIPAFGASCRRELKHRAFPAVLEPRDLRRIADDFARAARRVRDGGVDGVEISCIPTGIIGQFWSPLTNVRGDEYGGSLANRMRFGLDLLERVWAEVGDDYVVGIRLSADEMSEGGLDNAEMSEIARRHVATGLVDFVSVVGGHSSDYKSTHDMYPSMRAPGAPYLAVARAVKEQVDVPLLHATRIRDAATAAYAVENGFVDLVGMTRAFIADPHHVIKLREGREAEIRPCVGASYCVDRVSTGHEALCLHNVATSREQYLDQAIVRSGAGVRRVAVIGGGPAGLESARIAAARGHEVTLFEAGPRLGGQLLLAARGTWRRDLGSIVDWLAGEVERLGVDLRLNRLVSADEVREGDPEVVIAATGGLPEVGHFVGAEHALTTWDLLSGQVEPGKDVLLFDEAGAHAGLSTAEFIARRGSKVELVTPDRVHGAEVGVINIAAHMTGLYGAGVRMTTDLRLCEIRRSGNELVARLANVFTGDVEERVVDQVVGDYGTSPNDALYEELKPDSSNLGETDLHALASFRAQSLERNPSGPYSLFRLGDAWASRNVHAAMLDAARVCQRL